MKNLPTVDDVRRLAFAITEDEIPSLIEARPKIEAKIIQSRGRLKKLELKLDLLQSLLVDCQEKRYAPESFQSVQLAAGAIKYLISNHDFIPDSVPVSGLSDDITLILLTWDLMSKELEKYVKAKGLPRSRYFDMNDA